MSLPLPTGLSPSKVASFKDCALAFRFSAIDHLPEPPAPHLARGTLVHRALELLFGEAPADRTLAAALAHVRTAHDEVMADPENDGLVLDDEDAWIADAERLVRNYFQLEDPTTVRAIGLELRLDVQVGSLRLRGIIDRLDLDENGELIVVDYKGLAVDTPLPTPEGWTTMGDVAVGDELLDVDGRPTRVVEKSGLHHRKCYRLEFDDASDIVCDNEHLWWVTVGTGHQAIEKVLNADELFALWQAGTRPITIPNAKPLDLPHRELPIDPYVLGVWLGDGNSRSGVIHVSQGDAPFFTAALQERGESVHDGAGPSDWSRSMAVLVAGRPDPSRCIRGHDHWAPNRPDGRRGDCRSCAGDEVSFPVNGSLRARLRSLGVLFDAEDASCGKRVPAQYLRAGRDQRLDLLRGLMDSDGYWNPQRKQAVFSTVNPELADAVVDLVCGLGGRAYVFSEQYPKASGPNTKYQVIFTPLGFVPFTLPRKADACVLPQRQPFAGRRAIRRIEEVPSVPTQCVKVDAPDSLYLAGWQMVPTHNTGSAPGVNFEGKRLAGVHFYAFLCEQVLGRRPAAIRLLHLKEPLSITSVPTDQSIRGLTTRTEAIWAAIERACEKEDFRPRPSRLCDFCAFREWCPAWGGDPANAPRPELAVTA